MGRVVDRNCEYSEQYYASTASRLASLLPLLPPERRGLPLQVMEYGLQENSLGVVDCDPGAWGGAWTLMSSVQVAQRGIERAYHWGFGDRHFANGRTICPRPLSRCGLYGGNMWVAAAAGHLFGNGSGSGTSAVVVLDAQNSSNASAHRGDDGGVSASGIGGWGAGRELRLLVSLFHPRKELHAPVRLRIIFDRPAEWDAKPKLLRRTMVLNSTTSVYDAVRAEAASVGTLRNASDHNVYTLKKMLTPAGLAAVQTAGERWLAQQRASLTSSGWIAVAEAGEPGDEGNSDWRVSCDTAGKCSVTFVAMPPAVVASWLRPA